MTFSALGVTRRIAAFGVAMIAMLGAIAMGRAEPQNPVSPPLSVARSKYFKANPTAWTLFFSQLPRRAASTPSAPRQLPPSGGSWQALNNVSGSPSLCNPLLLTDGSVMAHDCETPNWWKLTPDLTGSYVNGSWKKLASLPIISGKQYAPQYNAAAVLPDGRVIIMGGEYNGSDTEVWTNLGAIYDPIADAWTPVSAPSGSGWTEIGDAASIVLPNGLFLLSSCCASPSVDALFNAKTLGWTGAAAPPTYQDEQGYTLSPSGSVLTVDVWDPPNAHQYSFATGVWTAIASTPVSLIDPTICRNFEIGPAVTRPDGAVVFFGGNTGCVAASPADPTAIYDASSKTWTEGPSVPALSVNGTSKSFDLADAPAAMLPNGNILFAASPGYGLAPTHFFEFTAANAINQVADDVYYSSSSGAYYYNFLVLPTGQILTTDFSGIAEIYTPTGGFQSSWAPTVISVPSCLDPGPTFALQGAQLNGLTQGAAYGDDVQGATNYPVVRIVNNATGHVFYARTFNHSTMSIAPGQTGSTSFTVAAGIETGASTLYVIANGIPSVGTPVTVSSSCALTVTPSSDIAASGSAGGPFTPSSFSYALSSVAGSVVYSITGVPGWLTASSTSGTATPSPTTITFNVNSAADSFAPGSYVSSIGFNNRGSSESTTRVATLNVDKGATATAISSSLNPAVKGQSVTFTATITGGDSPTGTVTFMDGSATLGAKSVSGGKAEYSTSALSAGMHSVTASYGGDAKNAGSASPALTEAVKTVTKTTVASSLNPSALNQSVTFTATITRGSSPTGTVTFMDGSATLGTGGVSGGAAQYSTSALPVGKHSITANYSGDATNTASASPAITETVTKAVTAATVTSNLDPSEKGQSVTFTATIAGAGGPTGMVIFKAGSATLGTGSVSGGEAQFSTSALSVGKRRIKATYRGDANNKASISPAIVQTVTKAVMAATAALSLNPSTKGGP